MILTNGSSILKIENTNDTPQNFLLLKISRPVGHQKSVIFSLCVAEENVPDTNYNTNLRELGFKANILSVGCYLPPAVLGGDGRMIRAKINGREVITGRWTPFQFEVARYSLEGLPTRLEVHLAMQGRLEQFIFVQSGTFMELTGSWWSPQQSGLIGGIGGSGHRTLFGAAARHVTGFKRQGAQVSS